MYFPTRRASRLPGLLNERPHNTLVSFFGQLVARNIHHLTKTAVVLAENTTQLSRWSTVQTIWSTVTYPNCVNSEQWHRMIYLQGTMNIISTCGILGFVQEKRIRTGVICHFRFVLRSILKQRIYGKLIFIELVFTSFYHKFIRFIYYFSFWWILT